MLINDILPKRFFNVIDVDSFDFEKEIPIVVR
jgi:hypothetical protein